jgi:molybdate transport system substrate-binding protein
MICRAVAVVVIVLATLGVAACGDDSADSPLTVFAAASLTDAFRAIDAEPRYSFAGSDQLAFQIEQGAPADVFAAASPKYPRALLDKGLATQAVTFATNTIVAIVPRENPAGIDAISDLTRPGLRLVIGDMGVPVGDYTRTVLQRLGLQRALDNVVSNEDDVRAVVAKVALGEADAGFVYATDARSAADRVKVVPVPDRDQPVIEYQVAVVASSSRPDDAQRFVDALGSPAGRAVLAEQGFGVPE